jgi:SagB-type dehydrogenase family enzyme
MDRRRFRYFLNWLLLAGAVVVILTGVVVDRLDLNDFTPHRWAGYAVAVLIVLHVGPRWRALLPTRRAPGREPAPSRATETPEQSWESAIPPCPVEPGDGEQPARGTASAGSREGRPHPTRRTAIAVVGAGVAGVAVGWTARSGVSPDPYPGGDVGLFYHRQSALGLRGLVSGVVDWGRRPAQYLQVGGGPSVPLPGLDAGPAMSVAQALQQRRSLRDYADRAMTTEELAWVIHGATGITQAQAGLRTAPSAGALYPLETYVAVSRVEGIEAGLYHVDVRGRALEPVRNGSVAGDLMVAGLGQDFLRTAPVVLILTGLFQRSRWKYRERHYRYVCWEGGHVTQNVYLAAEAAGLGACMVGAFLDGRVNDLLGVDGRREAALGLIALGPR